VDVVEVLVAEVVVVVGDHLVGLALEAHRFVAATAGYSVAAIDSVHGDLAGFVRTLPDTVLLHVLLEDLISSLLCLLAGEAGVVAELSDKGSTLQLMQKTERQTSHSMESDLIMLICLHPAV
jgi:hypothetical protein